MPLLRFFLVCDKKKVQESATSTHSHEFPMRHHYGTRLTMIATIPPQQVIVHRPHQISYRCRRQNVLL